MSTTTLVLLTIVLTSVRGRTDSVVCGLCNPHKVLDVIAAVSKTSKGRDTERLSNLLKVTPVENGRVDRQSDLRST